MQIDFISWSVCLGKMPDRLPMGAIDMNNLTPKLAIKKLSTAIHNMNGVNFHTTKSILACNEPHTLYNVFNIPQLAVQNS